MRRLIVVPLLALLVFVGACSLPNAQQMQGQLPIRIDKVSNQGVDWDCNLAMLGSTMAAISTVNDVLRDDESGRRQVLGNYFYTNPGLITVWTEASLQAQRPPPGQESWRKWLKYGVENGLAGVGTWSACKDTLDHGNGIYYWCGTIEQLYIRPDLTGWNEEQELGLFFESGWYLCNGYGEARGYNPPFNMTESSEEIPEGGIEIEAPILDPTAELTS